VYKFDRNMKPIVQPKAVAPLSGEYLEKRGLLRAALVYIYIYIHIYICGEYLEKRGLLRAALV
jgi:hypothetical protein